MPVRIRLGAVSDALRREVDAAGIKVVVVEPGAVKTEIAERGITTSEALLADMTAAQLARYGELMNAVMAQARSFNETGVSADTAASGDREGSDRVSSTDPLHHWPRCCDSSLQISRFVSDRGLDRIVRLNLRRFAPRPSRASTVRSG